MLHFSATALTAAVVTTLSCGIVYKLSACVSPRICASYAKFKTSEQRDWDSRVPSTAHALAITAATVYALRFTDVFEHSRYTESGKAIMLAKSDLTEAALGMSLGYFVADFGVILSHFPHMGGPEMIVHHIAAILSIWTALTSQQGHFYALTMLATEITTPFVNLRWHLDVANKKSSRAYLANGMALFVSWFVARVLCQLYLFWHLYLHRMEIAKLAPAARVLVMGVPPLLFSLNLWWFTKICKGIYKLLAGSGSSGKQAQAPPRPQLLQQNGKVHLSASAANTKGEKAA